MEYGNIANDGTECKYAKDITETTPETDYYIVHPAFTSDVNNGGWNKELEGIWVAKYEAGAEVLKNDLWQGKDDYWNNNSGDIAISDTVRLVSKPGIKSWRCINIANAYTNSKNYNSSIGSHLMKNSEWGAVAYLTHSCYGRNGTQVTNNSKTDYITAGGNMLDNNLQSSTGNLYGIYDLNGGSYERVAAYYNGYNTSNFTNEEFLDINGNMFASYNGLSDEYATVYTGRDFEKDYKRGDATTETRGWNGDNYGFVDGNDDNTFFYRDGSKDAGEKAGIFAATGTSGKHDFNLSFRVTLCF